MKPQILGARSCDDEVASIMDQLSRLQTKLVLAHWIDDVTLIQDTRCLIVERCFTRAAIRSAAIEHDDVAAVVRLIP